MANKLIIGNWKMNPESASQARVLFNNIKKLAIKNKKSQVVICAPYIYLSELKKSASVKMSLGAQNVSEEIIGPYTGDISVKMLKDLKIKYTIVGHSERRAMGETDEMVSKKINLLLKNGITPILCVGEKHRDKDGEYLTLLKQQLLNSLVNVPKSSIKKIVIAYEPVWAIGKDAVREATPHESMEMAIFIKKVLTDISDMKSAHDTQILFGGSVTKENAQDFLANGGVNGLLVGRASLSVKDFGKIIEIAEQI